MDSLAHPRPALIVTVDTEEEGLWSGEFRRDGYTVRNVQAVPRFQSLCDRFQVRPTYLVDTPVVSDLAAVELLRSIQDDGRCEIGAHLHPWCAPPFEEPLEPRNSFLCNLPPQLQREKVKRLTAAITERFGRRPSSFRAGRYGLDIIGAKILDELGFVVDSSVLCFYDYAGEGGPDHSAAPTSPYRIGDGSLTTASPTGRLWEVPVSVGYSRRDFHSADRWYRWSRHPLPKRLRVPGVLDRLGVARRIKFSPEQTDARRMNQLADLYVDRGAPCLVMILHSSSLAAGFTPYVRDEAELQRFYEDLEATLSHCRGRLNMTSATLTEFVLSRTKVQRPPTRE